MAGKAPKLSYKARRRWSLVILLIGLPIYVVVAVTAVDMLQRPSFLVELAIYVGLGFLWALPFKFVFLGVGQADPDAGAPEAGSDPGANARKDASPDSEKPSSEKAEKR